MELASLNGYMQLADILFFEKQNEDSVLTDDLLCPLTALHFSFLGIVTPSKLVLAIECNNLC